MTSQEEPSETSDASVSMFMVEETLITDMSSSGTAIMDSTKDGRLTNVDSHTQDSHSVTTSDSKLNLK